MKLNDVILASILAMGLSSSASAHGDAKGPHGGQIVEMPPYHTEFQVSSGMLHIYVLGEKDKPVAVTDLNGSIVIQFADGKKIKEKLTAMGDALTASATVSFDKPFVAIATLNVKGKAYTARYSHNSKKDAKKSESHD